jgi:hypothetical protein
MLPMWGIMHAGICLTGRQVYRRLGAQEPLQKGHSTEPRKGLALEEPLPSLRDQRMG